MATKPDEYHLVFFDPGGTIGWAYFELDQRAFSRPEHKVLASIRFWDSGEFTGQEHEQEQMAVDLIDRAMFGPMPFNSRTDIGSEDFELTQMIGGKNLLSPVRINAVLDWECRKHGLTLQLQARQLRTSVTRERLKLWGFDERFRKDEFAAVQHAITWLRRVKQKSLAHPWKLSDGSSHNAFWDCACSRGRGRNGRRAKCDLIHPN